MDVTKAIEFAGANHHAVLHTCRADGSAQLSPVLVGVDGDALVISSRETAMKVKNLARDRRATVCVFTDGFFGEWVVASGNAEIIHLPEAMELLVDYYRTLMGEHPDWDEYRSAMENERRVIVRIAVDRAGPDTSG